jgi:hypothetical protein
VALRRAAREHDCRLVVSLKWDFKANWGDKAPMRVPRPGSPGERDLHRCATRYLRAIGAPVDVVVLGNEPMWETLDADAKVEDPPIVEFTRNAKDHLVEHGDHGDPSYLVGAFNHAHDADTRERQYPHLYRGMFDLVREDRDVDGVDLHVHYGAFAEAEGMVAVARRALPEATITATEFSPVWRYYRHKHTPIGASDAGRRFANEYGLPTGMTTVEYFERAKRDPRPPAEVADFYDAMPWYNVEHVRDVHALLAEHDVGVGTFGFLAGVGMRNEDWTSGWLPFHVNFLYQAALVDGADGVAATGHVMDPLLTLRRGRSYVLEMVNDTAWPHPIHLHGHSFRVIARDGAPTEHREWRDTVLMAPRERVDVAFVADNPGDWMFHCHVLEHQAGGMMGVIRVVDEART